MLVSLAYKLPRLTTISRHRLIVTPISYRELISDLGDIMFSSPTAVVAQVALLGGLLVQSVDAQYYKIGTKGTMPTTAVDGGEILIMI